MWRLFSFLVLITACIDNNNVEELSYFDNSDVIKTRKKFNSKEDFEAGNFLKLTYDIDKVLIERANFKNNTPNGKLFQYYNNGLIKHESFFQNGVKNGIDKWYNENGLLVTEKLFLNGDAIVLKNYAHFMETDTYGYQIFRLKNDTVIGIEGVIELDENLTQVDTLTFYYKTNIKDTLSLNKKNDFEIYLSLLEEKGKINFEAFFGPLNKRFEIVDTMKIFKAQSNERQIDCYYIPDIKGYQVITGLISIEKINPNDSTEAEYKYLTFYHSVFVE